MGGTRIQQILGQAVQSGHVLLLFAYLQFRRPQASSIKEEQMITSTVLEWLRNISLETGPGVEPKLPLLYRQLVTLLQRQNEFSVDQGWTCSIILQFSNVLSHKGKFLARSLLVYLRMLVNMKKTSLMEKLLDDDSLASRKSMMSSSEIKPHIEKLSSFKNNKAFSGIH